MNKNIEELQGLIDRHFAKSKNSLMSIGISKREETFKYDLRKNNGLPIDQYGLGSISKTILATYLAKLINQGKVSLNQTLDAYLPLNSRIRYPTVLQLATHTSGYHGFIPLTQSMMILIHKKYNKKNLYSNIDTDWLVKDLNRRRPYSKKNYRYSDYNYAVLAMLIEKIEKRPYRAIIEKFLRDEIGMENTVYGSHSLTRDSRYSWYWENDNPFLPAGGLFSTTDDMSKFLKYQISHAVELAVSHRPYVKMKKKNIYSGFSWNAFHNGSFYWHIGGQGYYRSYALFDIKREITIVLLTTVDIDLIHVGRIGSSLYRNIKRNPGLLTDFMDEICDKSCVGR